MIYREPGEELVSTTQAADDLLGTLTFRFVNSETLEGVTARSTTGVEQSEDEPTLYSATREAPDELGTYSREWWAGTGNPWFDTEDLEVIAAPPADVVPTLEEVAALEQARTAVMGTPRGTFDSDTNPTGAQVHELIGMAVADVAARVGTIPEDFFAEARRLAALQAASLIESSYFPKELDTERSAHRTYSAMYLAGVEALKAAIPRALRLV